MQCGWPCGIPKSWVSGLFLIVHEGALKKFLEFFKIHFESHCLKVHNWRGQTTCSVEIKTPHIWVLQTQVIGKYLAKEGLCGDAFIIFLVLKPFFGWNFRRNPSRYYRHGALMRVMKERWAVLPSCVSVPPWPVALPAPVMLGYRF